MKNYKNKKQKVKNSFSELDELLNKNSKCDLDKDITKLDNSKTNFNEDILLHPNMIDNDIENFKINLDSILNKIKLESVNQIFITKNKLLKEQKIEIEKSEIQNKTTINNLKNKIEDLNLYIHEIKEELLDYKNKFKYLNSKYKEVRGLYINNKNTIKYYMKLKDNAYISKSEKKSNIIVDYLYKFKTKTKVFNLLKKLSLSKKVSRLIKQEKTAISKNFENFIYKMKEENDSLKSELISTKNRLKLELESKNDINKKIKSAFIKGINAMNMEAMGSLNIDNILDHENLNNIDKKTDFAKNFENSQKNSNTITINNNNNINNINNNISNNSSKKVILNNHRSENKDHKWIDAPIYRNN